MKRKELTKTLKTTWLCVLACDPGPALDQHQTKVSRSFWCRGPFFEHSRYFSMETSYGSLAGLALIHRLRSWANIKRALVQYLVFTGAQ